MSEPTTDELRERFAGWGGQWQLSHNEWCWKVHPHCAMRIACDRIEALEAENARLKRKLEIAEEFITASLLGPEWIAHVAMETLREMQEVDGE